MTGRSWLYWLVETVCLLVLWLVAGALIVAALSLWRRLVRRASRVERAVARDVDAVFAEAARRRHLRLVDTDALADWRDEWDGGAA